MKQYNSTTLVRTIWSLLLVISALCLIPTTAEAQFSVRSTTRATIKGFHGGTGQVRLTLSRGKAPYTVKLTAYPEEYRGQQTTFTSQKEETIIYNLPKGRYTLEVSDANGSVETVSSSVGEVGVGLNDFRVNAKWSQLHTSNAKKSRWISTRIFDGVPRYYSSEIDSIAKYFDIAICVPNDYFNGYMKGQENLNWWDLKEAKKAPTFEGDHGCWLVQDPVYDDNLQPTGQTVERSHLFVKVPDNMLSANKTYYESDRWANSPYDTEMMGVALRVKGSTDRNDSFFSYAKDLFDGRQSFDPNNWLEVTNTKLLPCAPYRPLFRIKKEAVERLGLKFPVTIKVRNRFEEYNASVLTLTFTEDNYTTSQTFDEDDGGLGFAVWNRIYMYDNDGHDSSLGLNPKGLSLGKEKHVPHALLYRYYRDTDTKKYRYWDEHRGWVTRPRKEDKHGENGTDFCAGTKDVVYAITLWETYYGYSYKNSFANATVTLLKAPSGYTPQNEYFPKIGVPVHISENHTSCDFFPFPNSKAPKDTPYMAPCYDVKIPEGVYVFRIQYRNVCGDEVTFFRDVAESYPFVYDNVQYKFSADAQDLKPQYEKVGCDKIRVYPFRGAKSRNILLRNGEPVPVHAMAVQTAKSGGRRRGSISFDPANPAQNPDSCYIVLPWRNSTVEIQYNYEPIGPRTKILSCLNQEENKLVIDTTPPTYDRDQLYTYICPSGKTAYVSVLPTRTAGKTLVELRDVKNKNKLYASATLPMTDQGKPVVFNLTGEQIQPEYMLYIKTGSDDSDCPLDNGGEIIKMNDLRGSSFIIGATNTKYCVGDTIKLECPPVTPESQYTWTQPDGTKHHGRKVTIGVADLPLSGEWQLEVTAVPCDGTPAPQTVPFILSVAPPELWWRKEATSPNWNSFENWADSLGNPIKAIPAKCTDVHLPAVVDKFYPNLDLDKTIREPLGEPVCNDIYFHFGSALGQPQRLTDYSRAFIDYNFGMAQSDGTIKKLEDPNHPKAYDRILERDRWYMIATPLKNVYTGDFSLAGYPLTYQRYLKVKFYGERPKEASFDIPMNKLGRPMVAYNHALAYKVEGYHPEKLGAKDHKNLNGLDGIIRLPFYENKERAPYYPLHRYYKNWYVFDKTGKFLYSYPEPRSYFAYFDLNTLKPVSKVDSVKRDTKLDYRFLFEDDKTNAIGRTRASTGKPAGEGSDLDWVEEEIEGYTMKLTSSSKSDKYVIVGNPFMSPISADQFFEVNKNNITKSIYIFTDGAWRYYGQQIFGDTSDDALKTIPPLQAFMVMLRLDGTPNVYFPTAPKYSVLVDPNSTDGRGAELRSTDEESSREPERHVAVKVTDAEGGYTSAVLLPEDTDEPIPAMIAPEGMQTAPLVYFISPTDSSCNFVQTNVPGAVVELGIFAPTDGMLTLDFTTLAEKPFDKLALYDRLRGTKQDLLANPTYSYGYSERDGRRFELRMSYGNVRYEPQQDHQADLAIERTATGYRISYDQGIAGYQLYSVHGYLLERATTDGQTQIDIEMPETDVVLLDVQSADGLRWIKKLQR